MEKTKKVNSWEFVLGLLIIFFSLTLSILFPLIAPLLGIVLLASGVYAYRSNANYTIAIATIVGGLLCLIIAAIIAFFIVTNTTTTASIENYPGRIP